MICTPACNIEPGSLCALAIEYSVQSRLSYGIFDLGGIQAVLQCSNLGVCALHVLHIYLYDYSFAGVLQGKTLGEKINKRL